jgi:Tn3 transposase DDE domain
MPSVKLIDVTRISSTPGRDGQVIYFRAGFPPSSWTTHVGLNKGEQQNALRRAVFFNRLGEIRDRSFENQRHRASGLNLLVAAIIPWNTTYLQRAFNHLRNQGHDPAPGELAHLSPLGWEHTDLTGDYHWETSPTLGPDQFRPLRTGAHAAAAAA